MYKQMYHQFHTCLLWDTDLKAAAFSQSKPIDREGTVCHIARLKQAVSNP